MVSKIFIVAVIGLFFVGSFMYVPVAYAQEQSTQMDTFTLHQKLSALMEQLQSLLQKSSRMETAAVATTAPSVLHVGASVQTNGTLRVRDSAGLRSQVLATVSDEKGIVVAGPVTVFGYTWWEVEYENGVTGWSAGYYLKLIAGNNTPPTDPPPTQSLEDIVTAVASDDPSCTVMGDFYWSIGDANGTRMSGSEGEGSVTSDTVLKIASASKLLFGTYVAEKLGGNFTPDILQGLQLTSGYSNFNSTCRPWETVKNCFVRRGNNEFSEETEGRFFYNGGHMQAIAANDLGLGNMKHAALAKEMSDVLGVEMNFFNPQIAGGAEITPSTYEEVLKGIVAGDYVISSMLGSSPVCTNPSICPDKAVHSVWPDSISFDYSIGHWVESDPIVGDGSYSSAGAFGFYPWISADKSTWGIVARENHGSTGSSDSVKCGKVIRDAYMNNK